MDDSDELEAVGAAAVSNAELANNPDAKYCDCAQDVNMSGCVVIVRLKTDLHFQTAASGLHEQGVDHFAPNYGGGQSQCSVDPASGSVEMHPK